MMRFIWLISGLILSLILQPLASIAQSESEEDIRGIVIIEDGYEKVDLYLHLSQSFKKTNIDSAIFYADQARVLALQEGDNKGVAESLFALGKIELRKDSSNAARDHLYRALDYTEDCECDSLRSSIYMFLGKLYTFRDNYSEAISNFLLSLEIAEEINNKYILSDLLDDIGLVMAFLEDYDQAMLYFNRAEKINLELNDRQNLATTLRNIGIIHYGKKQYLKAEEHYLEALVIYTDLNYYPGMSTAKIGIGNTEFKMGNYDVSLKHYKEALALAEKIDINSKVSGPFILALVYNRLGENYLKMGNFSKAIESLRVSTDLSEEMGMPGRKADAAYFFSQVYEKMGNTMLAFEYFKTYNALSDSIINAKNVSSITKLQMEYQYLKKQKEKELLEIQEEAAAKRKELLYQLLISIATVIVILLVVILILYRKNERNKSNQAELREKNLALQNDSLQKELEYKNKELTTNVMYQLKKNNFIWSISEKLKSIILNLKPENKKVIKEVVKDLESNMTKESWEEFEYRFNDVHNGFYDNLIKDFPDLTPNELKLSAFLKLNMTTKDIGTITYQTTHSITVARHRLRTKLGLERDDNLVSFLAKY